MTCSRFQRTGRTLAIVAGALLLSTASLGGCQAEGDKEGSWFDGGNELPPSDETLRMTARILSAKGDFVQAGVVIERMLYEFPLDPGTYTEGAEVLLQQGRVTEAIEFLDLGLERLPGHAVLLNDRGLCSLLVGDLGAARADFEATYAVDPKDSDYVANVALALALSGDEDEARRFWSRVLPSSKVEANLAIARAARPRFSTISAPGPD